MADMRGLALRHAVKAHKEMMLARQILAADAALWGQAAVVTGGLDDLIAELNRKE